MNHDTPFNNYESDLKKRLLYTILFIVYPAYVLLACVISPIHTITDSNIAYKILPLIFYFLNVIIDILVIYLSLATVIYGMYRLPLSKLRSLIILALCAPIFKNILKLLISPIVDGIPTVNNLLVDIYSLALSGLFEVLQLAAVIFLSYAFIKKHKQKALNDPSQSPVPFQKLIDLKNPLQFGAFISSLVISAIRLSMWVIKDLTSLYIPHLDMLFFLPYVLEIIGGVVGYLFILYVFISFASKEKNYN